jgi:hypothetical protein
VPVVPHEAELFALESYVTHAFRKDPDLTDYQVIRAYEALLDTYAAEQVGRERRLTVSDPREVMLYEGLHEICEWMLGRKELILDQDPELYDPIQPVPVIQACLKRLVKSAKGWSRDNGRQGYLTFVSRFI